jgi:hypothetical protein
VSSTTSRTSMYMSRRVCSAKKTLRQYSGTGSGSRGSDGTHTAEGPASEGLLGSIEEDGLVMGICSADVVVVGADASGESSCWDLDSCSG